MDAATASEKVLDAAEELYYSRGVQAVGMDAVRTASGVSLKRLYQLYPSKGELVDAYLRRRDARLLRRLAEYVDAAPATGPVDQVLAVFDWLYEWFSEPDYRGCAFINAYGELGATSPAVAEAARAHKEAFQHYLTGLVTAAGLPAAPAGQLALLAEGAITTAAISRSPEPARQAREAARILLSAASATSCASRTVHTSQLSAAELAEIRALLDDAFEGDFGDEDWAHGLGGVHALVRDEKGLAAHGSVIMRRVEHEGRSYRIGYVEALAVRADRRRQGLGGLVMAELERVIDRAYDFGALSASDDGAALYRARGWLLWAGRIEAFGPNGAVRLPDEEDSTYLRAAARGPLPAPPAALVFDWRDGDVL